MNTDREIEKPITVTAIVAAFNRAEWLTESLESLLAQSRPIDEIIVVDDASSDDTDQLLARYCDRVRTIRNIENTGQPGSLNFAIPLARGSHIWIFDDDDVALPDALEKHIAFLQSRPDIDFSYSDKYIFNGDDDIWQRDRWYIDPLPNTAPEDFLRRTLYTQNTQFQCMLIPKRCYERVGLFDETLDRCLDHDMLLRLAMNFRAGNAGHPSFVYREHTGVRGSKGLDHQASERFRVMLEYRQTLFRRVWNEFPLTAFTPNDRDMELLISSRDTVARLQRGCIMLHHGLIDEALADFNETLPEISERDYTHMTLRDMMSKATQVETWMWPRDRRNLVRLASALAQTSTLAFASAMARGFYWQAHRDFQHKDRYQGLISLKRMTYFLGKCQYYRLAARR